MAPNEAKPAPGAAVKKAKHIAKAEATKPTAEKPAAAKPGKQAEAADSKAAGKAAPQAGPSKPKTKTIIAPPKPGVAFSSHNWLAIQQTLKDENRKRKEAQPDQPAQKPKDPDQHDPAKGPRRKRRKIDLNAEVRRQREEQAAKREAEGGGGAPSASLEPTSDDSSVTRVVALDCEFVGVGFEGRDDALARVCVVNHYGNVLYDTYVRPREAVVDYRTAVSGILPKHLKKAADFKEAQARVAELIQGRVLVGHAIHNDLAVLLLPHPKRDIRDTARYVPLRTAGAAEAKPGAKKRIPALRVLAERVLGVQIQSGSHDPTEDARAAMALYRKFASQWEKELAVQRRAKAQKDERERRREAKGAAAAADSGGEDGE